MNYEELLEKARETYESEDTPHVVKAWLLANIIYPTDESEDERTRKELIEQIAFITPNNDELDDECNVLPTYQKRIDKYRAWLEKQGEKLDADYVIEWLDKNAPKWLYDMTYPARFDVDTEDLVKQFKKDFGL